MDAHLTSQVMDDIIACLRAHYTGESTAPNLAVVKCLRFQSLFSLSKTKSSFKIIKVILCHTFLLLIT